MTYAASRLQCVGACPFDEGPLLLLCDRTPSTASAWVILAPCCGIAWREHPRGRLDVSQSLADLRVRRVAVPTASQITGTPWEKMGTAMVPGTERLEYWAQDIRELAELVDTLVPPG